jgi:hypothetical protein
VCLELQREKVTSIYGGGGKDQTKHDTVVALVTRSFPKVWKFHRRKTVHSTITSYWLCSYVEGNSQWTGNTDSPLDGSYSLEWLRSCRRLTGWTGETQTVTPASGTWQLPIVINQKTPAPNWLSGWKVNRDFSRRYCKCQRDQSLYSNSDKIDVIDKLLISASEYKDIPFWSRRRIRFPTVTPARPLKTRAYKTNCDKKRSGCHTFYWRILLRVYFLFHDTASHIMTVLLPHYVPKAHNVKNPCSKRPWQVLFSTRKCV